MFDHPFSNTLYEHYEAINSRIFAERDARLYGLKSREEARGYVEEAKRKLHEIFALPPRPAPESRITGSFEANKVLVDKLVFRCSGERWCSAWFMRLPGSERRPPVLVVCGHSIDGKFSEFYQMAAFSLARKGFGVMFMDPIGQGEMYQHRDIPGLGATEEHNYLGRFCTLEGTRLCTLFVDDAMCAIDNLLARPEVLPGPVGVTGNSGGGQMTYFLHGLDEFHRFPHRQHRHAFAHDMLAGLQRLHGRRSMLRRVVRENDGIEVVLQKLLVIRIIGDAFVIAAKAFPSMIELRFKNITQRHQLESKLPCHFAKIRPATSPKHTKLDFLVAHHECPIR